jgi:hypothetical protein
MRTRSHARGSRSPGSRESFPLTSGGAGCNGAACAAPPDRRGAHASHPFARPRVTVGTYPPNGREEHVGGEPQPELIAANLGLSTDELKELEVELSNARGGLTNLTKGERSARAARRLGLTPPELQALGRAVAGLDAPLTVRLTAKRIISRGALQTTLDPPRPARPDPNDPRRGPLVRIQRASDAPSPQTNPAARATPLTPVPRMPTVLPGLSDPSSKAPPRFLRDWSAETNVYVTSWGSAIHRYADCRGVRGFRHANEPDPQVFMARVRDPVCADRRPCLICFDVWSHEAIKDLELMLEGLHGNASPPRPAAQVRPAAPVSRAPSTSAVKSKKQSKQERDLAAARRQNISVAELRAQRREQHEEAIRRKQGR